MQLETKELLFQAGLTLVWIAVVVLVTWWTS